MHVAISGAKCCHMEGVSCRGGSRHQCRQRCMELACAAEALISDLDSDVEVISGRESSGQCGASKHLKLAVDVPTDCLAKRCCILVAYHHFLPQLGQTLFET